jgi:transposase InsO family protein
VSRYRYIVAEKAGYPVRLLCRVLEVSASGFYAWRRRGPSDRERADGVLLGLVRAIHGRSRGTYGAPRVQAELRQGHGQQVGRKRIEGLMRGAGLAGYHQRRRRGLTKPDPTAAPAPDLIGRDFSAASPDRPAVPGARMVGDITYLATGEGWLYLADALDLATRSVLGYAMADHMRASLVVDALRMAAGRTALPAGAIFHSDRGSQYTSTVFADACTELGVSRSMGRTGSCFDNAAAESFWATLKRELGRCWWPTRAEARRAVFEYITVFYNRRRRHSALGYRTPYETLAGCTQRQALAA